jgi:hypothetical protein
MPANVSQIVRATAPHGHRFGIFEFLDIDFVIGRIAIVLNPEGYGI